MGQSLKMLEKFLNLFDLLEILESGDFLEMRVNFGISQQNLENLDIFLKIQIKL